jgi:chromosomal replication initiator protein
VTAKAWERVLAQLRGEVSEQVFETWLRPLRFVAREGPILFVATPHKFFKEWIEENHLARIEEISRKELAEEVTVEILVGNEEEDPLSPAVVSSRLLQLPEETVTRARSVFGPLNNRYTFDRFVVGTGNQFAHAASVAVANDPGNSYNPLFVYGGVGLGKTHLLHAIGNAALEKSPRLKVCYIPAEKFTNDLIASLRSGKMSDFKERYRNVDLLLMDDVQFIAGKRSTQEEFFHTFNELYSSRRQVVVSSDKFPKEIPDLEERIQSRFEWGLVADIQAPDIETRVAILNRKAEAEQILLPEDVALYLATMVKNNIAYPQGDQPRTCENDPRTDPWQQRPGGFPRSHPEIGRGALRREGLRASVRPEAQGDRDAAPGGDVPDARDDALLFSRHREAVRGTGSHHGDVRRKKN